MFYTYIVVGKRKGKPILFINMDVLNDTEVLKARKFLANGIREVGTPSSLNMPFV